MTNPDISDRLLSLTGHTDDLDEALDEFENVKAAVSELHDENQALEITPVPAPGAGVNRRLKLCLELAHRSMTTMQTEAGMRFAWQIVTEKTRAKAEKFFEQYEKLDAARMIVENVDQ